MHLHAYRCGWAGAEIAAPSPLLWTVIICCPLGARPVTRTLSHAAPQLNARHGPNATDDGAPPGGARPGGAARAGGQEEEGQEEEEEEEDGQQSVKEEKPPDYGHETDEAARLSASRESSLSGYSSSGGGGGAGKRGRGRPPRKRSLPSEGFEGAWSGLDEYEATMCVYHDVTE